MSLIHAALRKVEKKRFKSWERSRDENPFKNLSFALERLQSSSIEKYQTKKRRKRLVSLLAACTCVVALVILGFHLYFNVYLEQTGTREVIAQPAPSARAVTPSPQLPPDTVIRNIRTVDNRDISHILPLAQVFPSLVGEYVCTGIIYDELRPAAIINGHILYEGDWINNARILHIDSEIVIMLRDRRPFALTVVS